MKLQKQVIILDVDDTIFQSSKEVIRQLNLKNNTNKTINDLTDYGYRSIDKNITQEDVNAIYDSDEFFDNVHFNYGAWNFVKKYIDKFDIVFVSYGTKTNLRKKEQKLRTLDYEKQFIHFYGCDINNPYDNKSRILFPNTYLVIDNHAGHLQQYTAEKKILLKNYQDVTWNQEPVNCDWYVVNSFEEIEQMIDFDLKLKNLGEWINE